MARTHPQNKTGSALLVTLLVMGLMTLLVLAFSTHVRLELRNISNHQDHHLAKANARLGLELALAQLQELAGADNRVTARAEILGQTNENGSHYWAGVWDSFTGNLEGWLVTSGNPDQNPTDQGLRFVGSETTGLSPNQHIFAPVRIIDGGGFGWYTSDEGVKVSLSSFDRFNQINLPNYDGRAENTFMNSTDRWRIDRARKMAPALMDVTDQTNGDSFFTHRGRFDEEIRNRQDTQNRLLRSTFLNDFLIFGPVTEGNSSEAEGNSTDLPQAFFDEFPHELTVANAFTLSNTLDGGLKQDLTHLRRMNSPSQTQLDQSFSLPQWNYLTPIIYEFVNFDKRINFSHDAPPPIIQPWVPENYMNLPISFHTAPLATEIIWSAGLGIRSGPGSGFISRNIFLYFNVIIEMLNPLTMDLNLANGSGGNPGSPADLHVRISNFPPITIRNLTSGDSTTIDLSSLVISAPSNSFNKHDPGYIRPNYSPTNSFTSETGGSGVFAIKIGEFPKTPSTWDEFEVVFGISDLIIEISEANTNSLPPANRNHWAFFLTNDPMPDGVPVFPQDEDPSLGPVKIQEIFLRNWGGFTIEYEATNNNNRFVHGGSAMNRTRLNSGIVTFGIHGKFDDEWLDEGSSSGIQNLENLFIVSDLRRKQITIDMQKPLLGDGVFYDIREPDDMSLSNYVRSDDFFQGAPSGSDVGNRRARLYDLPTQEPISLGVLNQLNFEGFGSQPLGNLTDNRPPPTLTTNGDGLGPSESLHNYFDRYFFSTIPENPADWDNSSILPNANIRKASPGTPPQPAELASARSSEHLIYTSGLNINSISPLAWRSVLQSRVLDDFLYTRAPNSDTEQLRNTRLTLLNPGHMFYNHPFGGDLQIASTSTPIFGFARHDDMETLTTNLRTRGPHEAFIQGVRELNQDQIDLLGTRIAEEVKSQLESNGRPFTSVTEFLNAGVLQTALDSIPGLNEMESVSNRRIPMLSPSYFSVGTLLNHIAPMLYARSDTFIIRSAGFLQENPTSPKQNITHIEALVQRVPDEEIEGFGRRFRVLQTRWIEVSP